MLDGSHDVTVVTAPREGYAREVGTIRHLLDGPDGFSRIVVVHEARCPRRIDRGVRSFERTGQVEHIHLDHRVGANECRDAGLAEARTPYVLFLDNDARLEPGAVARLLERARATDASFVSPVCLNGDGSIHYTGSVVRFTGIEGQRHLFESRLHENEAAEEVRPWLDPVPTDAPELHGVLVHRESLVRAGGFDRQLYAAMDCLDLGLRLQDVAGGGWLEPAAAVVYTQRWPRPSQWPLYFDRWSHATVEHDIADFTDSWGIHPGTDALKDHRYALERRRWKAVPKVRGLVRRTVGNRVESRLVRAGDAVMDRFSSTRPASR